MPFTIRIPTGESVTAYFTAEVDGVAQDLTGYTVTLTATKRDGTPAFTIEVAGTSGSTALPFSVYDSAIPGTYVATLTATAAGVSPWTDRGVIFIGARLAAMTLFDARAFVRNLIFERSGRTGLVTETELTGIVDLAHRLVWKDIAQRNPDLIKERVVLAYDPLKGGIPLSEIGLPPMPVMRVTYVEVLEGDSFYPVWAVDTSEERVGYEPGRGSRLASKWYVENGLVRFTPELPAAATFRVTWVPHLPKLTCQSDLIFNGIEGLLAHEDMVVVKAACIAYNKDEKGLTPFDSLYVELRDQLQAQVAKTQDLQGRRVRYQGLE